MRHISTTSYAFFLLVLFALPMYGQQSLWTEISSTAALRTNQTPTIKPTKYRTYKLDENSMKSLLNKNAAMRSGINGPSFTLDVPMSDGSFKKFIVQEYSIMEEALAAKFPAIKAYSGYATDNNTITIKADFTEKGFHAMILDPIGDDVFVDPYGPNSPGQYISYYKKDFTKQAPEKFCETDKIPANIEKQRKAAETATQRVNKTIDRNLRTYRLAVATTYEYTQFHGGTKSSAMSAIVTTMNRVNGVYEKEVAVRMVLVGNNDQVIYTTSSDPYTNNDGGAMLDQNRTTINNVIGSSNYDIGHVFSTGGGGVAFLGCVCSSNKAGGVTGSGSPVGDPFDIDYVAHEMGHQFGANHTFNNSCGGNRNGSTAYEPGSGITIMAYAGICSPNVGNNSDPVFHAISLQEIVNFISTGGGNSCAAKTLLANNIPTANAGNDYTIPRGTPFTLTGSATDADGTSNLTYSWEQMNNEVATMPPTKTATSGPAFRTFLPTSSPSRTFPRMQDIINNASPQWEVLSDVARTYRFRFVVRDNNASGGFTNNDEAIITVAGTAGPFAVTAPNTAVSWAANSTQTVTWNVAGSNTAPVSCSNVDILLSTNGGTSYPVTIASNVPNTGSATITVPNNATTQARIMIRAVGNIFFDISNANFTITGGSSCTATVPTGLTASSVTASSAILSWNAVSGASYDVQYRRTGTTAWTTVSSGATSVTLSGLASSAQYEVQVRSKCGTTTSAWSGSATFTTSGGTTCSVATPTGLAASNITATSATLSWNLVNIAHYDLRYRASGTTTWTTVSPRTSPRIVSGLTTGVTYQAQVRSRCPGTTWSSPWSTAITFTTGSSITYCAAKGNSTTDEYIQRVTIGSINNNSGNNNGYGNFTNLSTDLAKGSSSSITIVPAWTGTVYTEAYRVWIDYNQNGSFDDSGELVYSRSASTATPITGSFTVPTGALSGVTRMRIIMRYQTLPSSCGNFNYGEVEDYSVNITGSSSRNIEGGIDLTKSIQVQASPNPAVNEVTVSIQLEKEAKGINVGFINQQGLEVLSRKETTPSNRYDVSFPVDHLSKGMYFIKVKANNQTVVKKIMLK